MKIGKYKLSKKNKPFLIAEISANHGGSLSSAKEHILAAKESGADAVKIQTYTAETMTINSVKEDFFIRTGKWKGQSLYSLYKKAETPYEWHEELFDYAKKNKIVIFSTPLAVSHSALDTARKNILRSRRDQGRIGRSVGAARELRA